MHYNRYACLCLVAIVLGQVASLPQHRQGTQQLEQRAREHRKFAEKSNAVKKVASDEADDFNSNAIQEVGIAESFWSRMTRMVMQTLLGRPSASEPSKTENDGGVLISSLKSLAANAIRALTVLIGGPRYVGMEGVDKESNDGNPTQFVHLAMNLLDAVKSFYSQRSFAARSMGGRDTISEAAVASASMLKGYVRSFKSFGNIGRAEDEGERGCAERALCEASAECVADAQGTTSIFCQLGSYATSYLLQRQSGVGLEALYEAGRRGRTGGDCRSLFVDCNSV
ncbi:uncharacterized protein LOC143370287 [Andrena cerasifolii]|uniref:uncharacterized protein LOC143370287 n=1 Tax=Andrena cerasifolii TaxID=2819439 RepID=UPI0040378FB8